MLHHCINRMLSKRGWVTQSAASQFGTMIIPFDYKISQTFQTFLYNLTGVCSLHYGRYKAIKAKDTFFIIMTIPTSSYSYQKVSHFIVQCCQKLYFFVILPFANHRDKKCKCLSRIITIKIHKMCSQILNMEIYRASKHSYIHSDKEKNKLWRIH